MLGGVFFFVVFEVDGKVFIILYFCDFVCGGFGFDSWCCVFMNL